MASRATKRAPSKSRKQQAAHDPFVMLFNWVERADRAKAKQNKELVNVALQLVPVILAKLESKTATASLPSTDALLLKEQVINFIDSISSDQSKELVGRLSPAQMDLLLKICELVGAWPKHPGDEPQQPAH